ncbi:MAG: glycoside hydrolase family 9 protein [Opitutaceae bacterium]
MPERANSESNAGSMRHRLLFACFALIALGAVASAQTRDSSDTASLALPRPGSLSLRIISPWILEVRLISEKPPDPAWVRRWPMVGANLDSPTLVPAGLRVWVDGRPVPIIDAGWKRRVAYAAFDHRDLRVSTRLYLRLGEAPEFGVPAGRLRARGECRLWAPPVSPGDRVAVADPTGLLWPKRRRLDAVADPLRYSPAIHVNQEGYVPSLPKCAMVGYYLGGLGELHVAPTPFRIVDARTGAPEFEGRLTPRPDLGFRVFPAPYQRVFEADFTRFRRPGEYRLEVPGLGASLPFLIDDGIAMAWTRTYALGLYEQRCGAANALPYTRFTHGPCHTAPAEVPLPADDPKFAFTWKTIAGYARTANPDNPPQIAPLLTSERASLFPFVRRGFVDVSGGHHDAGDYSKYTINSAQFVHDLIFAVDNIPGARTFDNLGIPESGDGIPDVLQEAKWEADFLIKMQDSDGGFYFLVYPLDREYESNVLPDHGDPQVVWPKNTSASAAATAALAEAGSSPAMRQYYPRAAAKYLRAARLGWRFLTAAIARYGKAGAYQKLTFYGDDWTHDDELAWAACAMYVATGKPAYERQLFAWFPEPSDPSTFRWGWWRLAECWGNSIRSYAFAARSGRLPASALDPRYLRACDAQIVAAADDLVSWTNDNAYGTPFPPATKAIMSGGWYFSLDQAADLAVAYQIAPKPEYVDALVSALNYEGGCNPVNRVFLTGLGVRRQREVVSQYAENDRRILPPSGIPIGQITAGFEYLPGYGLELRHLSYPPDDAAIGPYALYDRWSDVHNVTTEYTELNQARGLMASAFLASLTRSSRKPWSHADASIPIPAGSVKVGSSVTLRLKVRGLPLGEARVLWEGRDQSPAFGPSFRFTPASIGPQWVEAEAEWPDGRRAFAAARFFATSPRTVWFDGALPAGAMPTATGGDRWAWLSPGSGPPPSPSGRAVHGWTLAPGLHEQAFNGAARRLSTASGDLLFAWVYIDPAHPPREIMLSWNDGSSWEHRAYWGENIITYGGDGSAGRRPMGRLPPAGRWVRLAVPAGDVGIEAGTLSGMSFSLVGGRCAWGAAGRAQPR